MGRHRNNPTRGAWHEKLHAVFFELANVNQEFEHRWAQMQNKYGHELEVAGRDLPLLRERAELEKWFEEKLVDINRRYTPVPYNPIAYSYLTLDPPTPDSQGLREYLHFHRHGESLRVSSLNDAQGDLKAWDKIARTEKDFRILSFGKGPIAPFQEDVVHRQLLQLVICYERERLTAEELVECFDKYCACGKKGHETDALRKMRNRFQAELNGR